MLAVGLLLLIIASIIVFMLVRKKGNSAAASHSIVSQSFMSSEEQGNLQACFSGVIEQTLSLASSHHEPELLIRKCLIAVANAAGQDRLAPKTYDLDKWATTAPQEYLRLLAYLRQRVAGYLRELELQEELVQQKFDDARECRVFQVINGRHQKRISKFFEILYDIVSARDIYGDEDWDLLDPEIDKLVIKMIKEEEMSLGSTSGLDSVQQYLNELTEHQQRMLNSLINQGHINFKSAVRNEQLQYLKTSIKKMYYAYHKQRLESPDAAR